MQQEELEQWAGTVPESTGERLPESSWAELSHGLPSEDVKLLEDRYLNDWSFERLAQELRLSEAGVRKRLSRLLQKIRRTPV
jgi:DNA-directed RNA polymerase specialized sigma24 family protein